MPYHLDEGVKPRRCNAKTGYGHLGGANRRIEFDVTAHTLSIFETSGLSTKTCTLISLFGVC